MYENRVTNDRKKKFKFRLMLFCKGRNPEQQIFKIIYRIYYVFNFPRFYSIFCVDFSQLFDPFHTYLKHGTVMGSNICEWKQKYLWMDNFPSYLFVYRQANLRPQLLKRNLHFWSIVPAELGSEPVRTRNPFGLQILEI